MKRFIMILTLAALSGCASLNNAGISSMKVKPYLDSNGNKACCEWDYTGGKEIGEVTADVTIKPDGSFKGHLHEVSVKAFEGQRISADVAKTGIRVGAAAASAAINPAAAVGALGVLKGAAP